LYKIVQPLKLQILNTNI